MTMPADDPTVATFEETADTLDRAAANTAIAARRVRHLRGERMRGRPWREVLGRREGRSLLELVGAAASQLSSTAGRLRRAIAHALLADGLRVNQIADVLGVSHQRISRLLNQAHRRPSPPG
jgi:AraC-like DNA-binding protein